MDGGPQLFPTADPTKFTAPESPMPDGQPRPNRVTAMRTFSVAGRTFRFAAHHTGNGGPNSTIRW